ncbi:MAG: tannase/feruloyl esterase family alpha/beta hydrolase [Actinomycetota bacterium]|nr:tannase/feruloyl esterase family alpha/beta hydrolase [Actinomycetota bacterium]
MFLSLLCGAALALAVVLSAMPSAGAQEGSACEDAQGPEVPGAERQDADRCPDLTTRTLALEAGQDHTRPGDYNALQAAETRNPAGPPGTNQIPGIQIDGYFPDSSTTNCSNNEDGFPCHDSQFVIRLPEEQKWNGKLVITGAPGVRTQFALDFLISDFVLSKGYAFASTDKGNTGTNFYKDGSRPGGSVVEWHRRVEQITKAAKTTVEQHYEKPLEYTYMTGISNGGYMTRHAIENNPELYDGSVDWEGVLWRRDGPNLFTHLPQALRHWNECKTSADTGYDNHACELMRRAGYPKGSEFLWEEHYLEYWDLTQRIYREEFDPLYDGDREEADNTPGVPQCQEEANVRGCDANYQYKKRPERVREAVEKVSLNGNIGKPMLTVTGTYDVLLPIRLHSDRYRALIENAGKGKMHRYYKIENGTHVDSYFDRYRQEPEPGYVRPITPCYWAAFEELEEWVERKNAPPGSTTVPHPNPEGGIEDANSCSINEEATYTTPAAAP